MHKMRNSIFKKSPSDTHNCCLLIAFIKINSSDNEILPSPFNRENKLVCAERTTSRKPSLTLELHL